MEEFEYAGSGVMLDRCVQGDGFWLDKDELEKVQIIMEYQKKLFELTPPLVETEAKTTERKCPLCNEQLIEREYEEVSIDICKNCGGVWLDKDELYQIVERRQQQFSPEQEAEVEPSQIQQYPSSELIGEINCVICGTPMRRINYGAVSEIIIDRCPSGHGVWLDKGELEKIQIYVEKSEDMAEKDYAKYTRILNQVRQDYIARQQQRKREFIESSPYGKVGRALRWLMVNLADRV